MLEYIIQGGYMMFFLMGCSIAALAVIIDRAAAFIRHRRVDTRSLRSKVLACLKRDAVEEAALLCADTPGPVAAVLLAGLQSYARHKAFSTRSESITTIMKEAMEDYSQHAMNSVEKRFNILSTVANAAPLFGMAGTVLGMISAFDVMASAGGIDAGLVAGGISEALITTAAGLLIALFAVIPFNMFTNVADAINLEINESISEMLDFVATQMEHRPGQA